MSEIKKVIPESFVQDKALAEEMAYAEKPFQEDALTLRGLIRRAQEQDSELTHLRPIEINESISLARSPQATNNNRSISLSSAHTDSLNLASDAAEQARKRFKIT